MANCQIFRTVTVSDTIPSALGNLLNGSVTTDTLNTDQLIYSGTSDLNKLFTEVQMGQEGSLWVWVPAATGGTVLAKVLGRSLTAANTYTILLDRAMPSATAAPIYYVIGDLKKYVVTNIGAGTGSFAGQSIPTGAFPISSQILWNYKQTTLDVQLVSGADSNMLVQEER